MKNKIVMGLLGILTASNLAVSPILANEQAQPLVANLEMPTKSDQAFVKINFGGDFSKFVEQGILSATDLENVQNFMKKQAEARRIEFENLKATGQFDEENFRMESKEEFKPITEQLVESGIITNQQAESIKAYESSKQEEYTRSRTERYFSEGIIDEYTKEQVYNYLVNEKENFTGTMTFRFKDSTESNENDIVTEGIYAVTASREDKSPKIVEDAIVTQTQFEEMMKSDMNYREKQRTEETEQYLAKMVGQGVISETTKNNVLTYMANNKPEPRTKIDRTEDIAARETIRIEMNNPFEDMVDNNILTQEEADKLQENFMRF